MMRRTRVRFVRVAVRPGAERAFGVRSRNRRAERKGVAKMLDEKDAPGGTPAGQIPWKRS